MTPNFYNGLVCCFVGLSSRSVFIWDLSLAADVISECGAARRVRESVFAVVVLVRNDRTPTKSLGNDD